MKLAELMTGLMDVSAQIELSGITLNSRHVKPGYAFLAINGAVQHGMNYLQQALQNGAVAVIYDPEGGGQERASDAQNVVVLKLPQLSSYLGLIAARYYRDPSASLDVIGVTGTNGKTSCSQFLAQLLPDCGVIGTLGWGHWGDLQELPNTTPDALTIQSILAAMLAKQKKTVAMEVSSHGLEQGRVNGIHFKGALFTNLSRDHLDYHGTMEDYLAAKIKMFTWPGLNFVVLNLDDPWVGRILDHIDDRVKIWGYTATDADYPVDEKVGGKNVIYSLDGLQLDIFWREQTLTLQTAIAGSYNLENILAVLTVLLASGMTIEQSVARLATLQPVVGRMERFGGGELPTVFVDYAHSPDALDKLLAGLKVHVQGKLKVVFGCGGDRDRGKRAQMGNMARKWANEIIVTDDNPRSEQPQTIVSDILPGCGDKAIVIHDREKAIVTAIHHADCHDCIVVAGKGHEQYQEINGIRQPFSDQQVVRKALSGWDGEN